MPVQSTSTVALQHGDFDQVKFIDHDGDIFFMGLGAAIKHCKRVTDAKSDVDADAVELLVILEEWMKANFHLVTKIAIRPEANRLHFYFASPSHEFNVELSQKLAEFESETIARLASLRVDTRQVSTAELEEIRALAESDNAKSTPAS